MLFIENSYLKNFNAEIVYIKDNMPVKFLTIIPVKSPHSKRVMAISSDLRMAALIR